MYKRRILLAVGLILFLAVPLVAQDPCEVAPNQCKVEFENESVRVLRWIVGPGEKIPMHEHPASVSLLLIDDHTKCTLADGKIRETDGKAGHVNWSDPEKHASQNLSDKPSEVIQIELKTKSGSETSGQVQTHGSA